jgi:hypothetical protein
MRAAPAVFVIDSAGRRGPAARLPADPVVMAPEAVVVVVMIIVVMVVAHADADAERPDVGADDGGVGSAGAHQGQGEDGREQGFHEQWVPEGWRSVTATRRRGLVFPSRRRAPCAAHWSLAVGAV